MFLIELVRELIIGLGAGFIALAFHLNMKELEEKNLVLEEGFNRLRLYS
jgi:hypothetical protein